jgi:hypothetical protein
VPLCVGFAGWELGGMDGSALFAVSYLLTINPIIKIKIKMKKVM